MRETVEWFTNEMEKKLQKNESRGGWQDCTNQYLISMLYEHVYKLELDLNRKDNDRIIPSAADIANIAMMIADNNRGVK